MKNLDIRLFSRYMCIIDDLVNLKPISYDWSGANCNIYVKYNKSANYKDIASEIDFLRDEKGFSYNEINPKKCILFDGFLSITIVNE